MKKLLVMVTAIVLLMTAWLGAERRAPAVDLSLLTSFDFSRYPACGAGRTIYCIQAIRFRNADTGLQLAEVPVENRAARAQRIAATLRTESLPRRVYAVTLYRDSGGVVKEGPAGEVSWFDDSRH